VRSVSGFSSVSLVGLVVFSELQHLQWWGIEFFSHGICFLKSQRPSVSTRKNHCTLTFEKMSL
jgi:hypothetical protein